MHHKLLHLMMMQQLLALPARLKKRCLAQLILQLLFPVRCLLSSQWLLGRSRVRLLLLRMRDVQCTATEVLARHALADDALLLLTLLILLLEPS